MTQKYCPKCKKQVDSNAIRCPHCGMRLQVVCPTCNTANLFGLDSCISCGTVLLKYCENCGSANFPDAKECRKCHSSLEEEVITFAKNRSVTFSDKFQEFEDSSAVDIQNSSEKEVVSPVSKEQTVSSNIVDENDQNIESDVEEIQNVNDVAVVNEIEPVEDDFQVNIENSENIEVVDDIQNVENVDEVEVVDDVDVIQDENEDEVEYVEEYEYVEEDEYSDEDDLAENEEIVYEEQLVDEDGNVISSNITDGFDETYEEVEEVEEVADVPQENIEAVEDDTPEISIDELIAQSENNVDDIEVDESQDIVFFDDAQPLLEQLSNIMQTPNNAVIAAVCAEEGMGKSTILKTFTDSLNQKGIVPIIAECSELIKVAPFGCIRDLLLKLLTLPDLHPDVQGFFSDETKQLFVQNFEDLNDVEITNFMNFLYPTMHANFDNIIDNRNITYALLEKIFTSVTTKNQSVFVIDDFDYIDTASFEFIENLIRKQLINNNTKLFITYRERKPARLYFDKDIAREDIFTTMYLNNLSEENTQALIKNFANTQQVPTAVNFAINEKGKGNIFFTEQFLALLFDVGYMFINNNSMSFKEDEPLPFLPKNIEEILNLRFKAISSADLKDALMTAAIIGYKFDKSAFAAVADISEEQTTELLQRLVDLMFIQPCSEYEYSFKNMTSWAVIFAEAHNDPRFSVICKKVYYILGKFALSNPIIKASVAKYRDEEGTATQAWIDVSSLCGYLGDTHIYALALEQFLIASGYTEDAEEYTKLQQQALEKIAKLIYKSEPEKAKKYLTVPIVSARENADVVKLVDLCGYMIKICYELSDNNGVCETVDMLLNVAGEDISALDKALILSRKLTALFNAGNCEEGINLANNDIIPLLEEELSKNNDPDFSQRLFTAWFDSSIALVKLYALQGNSKSVDIVDNTEEILQMNNIEDEVYTIKLSLAKAFALTVIGKIQDSVNLLKSIEQLSVYDNPKFINERNLIFALNLVFSNVTNGLREILFEYAKYAENSNDKVGKHIYKLMLAWLTYSEGEYVKANNIFDEELTYYAQEKIVTGALISWLFIAKNALAISGVDSAEHVAMKALEVAQNPKFSQYHIAVYLQKLVAEINLAKGDESAAKMYLEKGMLIAKQFGLSLAQIELYRTYVNFLKNSLAQAKASDRAEIADKIEKTYQSIIEDAEKIKVPGLIDSVRKEYEALTASV